MRIDSAGLIGIGGTPTAGVGIHYLKALTGGTGAGAMAVQSIIQSDVTSSATVYNSLPGTQAASFTLANLYHYFVNGIGGSYLPGAGSAITNQTGFGVNGNLSGATNNYAFSSNVAAGTGRWNVYMGGTAANYLAGRLGVGATLTSGAMAQVTNTTAGDKAFVVQGAASQTGDFFDVQNSAGSSRFKIDSAGNVAVGSFTSAGYSILVSKNFTGGTTAFGIAFNGTVQSDVTSGASVFLSSIATQAASFTLTNLYHFRTDGLPTPGSGNTITTQHGFFVGGSLTGATNNYGFRGAIASGTNRWNIYMDGTAANHLAGNLCVGTTAIATSADKAIHMGNGTAPTANIASGGILYVESGALKYRGSSGTITTLGAA